MASDIKFGLRFEISNLHYSVIHVNIVSNSHFGISKAKTASGFKFDLLFEIRNLNYLICYRQLYSFSLEKLVSY